MNLGAVPPELGGREIPSFFILWINVVRFMPSLAAAPVVPPITQPTDSSVLSIRAYSESLSVVPPRWKVVVCRGAELAGKGFGSKPSLDMMTARSMRL